MCTELERCSEMESKVFIVFLDGEFPPQSDEGIFSERSHRVFFFGIDRFGKCQGKCIGSFQKPKVPRSCQRISSGRGCQAPERRMIYFGVSS